MPDTLGVILAGGLARRMGGGDKALRSVGGQTVMARLIERMTPQVSGLVLNANADPARFAEYGLPVAPDSLPDHPGPLAGVLAGLDWATLHAPSVEWIVTVPGDAPFVPEDLVTRLHAGRGPATFACAASGGRTHPVVGLWPLAVRDELHHAVTALGQRKIDAFTQPARTSVVEWAILDVDPFFNVNTPEDLVNAERLARP